MGPRRAQGARGRVPDAAAVRRAVPDASSSSVVQRPIRHRRQAPRGLGEDGDARRISGLVFYLIFVENVFNVGLDMEKET